MMTTGSAFGINERITDPIMGPQSENRPPTPAPAPKSKEQLLQEAIEKFSKGEITEKQLAVIKKTLE
jgi:hypothetical protein